ADRERGMLVVGPSVELLDHLDDRPVGDPFAVGETAAVHDARIDPLERLRGEPRLADSRIADDRDELAAWAGERPVPDVGELLQLALTADEAECVRALHRFASREKRVSEDRLALALQFELPLLSDLDRPAHEPERFSADQDLARLRRLLQTRSDV